MKKHKLFCHYYVEEQLFLDTKRNDKIQLALPGEFLCIAHNNIYSSILQTSFN